MAESCGSGQDGSRRRFFLRRRNSTTSLGWSGPDEHLGEKVIGRVGQIEVPRAVGDDDAAEGLAGIAGGSRVPRLFARVPRADGAGCLVLQDGGGRLCVAGEVERQVDCLVDGGLPGARVSFELGVRAGVAVCGESAHLDGIGFAGLGVEVVKLLGI